MKRFLTFAFSAVIVTLCATMVYAASEADETEREVTLSLKGLTCPSCWGPIDEAFSGLDGVFSTKFDWDKSECYLVVNGGITDSMLFAAVASSGFSAVLGAGFGEYADQLAYPDSADMKIISFEGEDVPDLKEELAPGKITIFDFFAEWCGPCRVLDMRLRELAVTRDDIAIRKVNIVNYKSPVAKHYLRRVRGIPYLIVYGKNGERIARITGLDYDALNKALAKADRD